MHGAAVVVVASVVVVVASVVVVAASVVVVECPKQNNHNRQYLEKSGICTDVRLLLVFNAPLIPFTATATAINIITKKGYYK